METPHLLPQPDRGRQPRIVRFLPSSPPLVPVLPPAGEIPPEVDRVLTMVASEAQPGDTAARNALYAACAPKIARFVRRYRFVTGHRAGIDLDDVAQEAFVAFADLVEHWPGGDSFCAYFLGHFPWELKNRVRRHLAISRRSVGFGAASELDLLTDGSAAASEAIALLRVLAEGLPEPDGSILLWRVRDGESFGTIARRLGTSRRTVMRAWDRTLADLRRSLLT
jgi:RNA polymerase sigma factor (sigma-70 family)